MSGMMFLRIDLQFRVFGTQSQTFGTQSEALETCAEDKKSLHQKCRDKTKAQVLKNCDVCLMAFGKHIVAPSAYLSFSDVGFSEEIHTQSGLPDAAADCLHELAVQKHRMELERCSFATTTLGKLALKRFGVHANTHRRKLHCAL